MPYKLKSASHINLTNCLNTISSLGVFHLIQKANTLPQFNRHILLKTTFKPGLTTSTVPVCLHVTVFFVVIRTVIIVIARIINVLVETMAIALENVIIIIIIIVVVGVIVIVIISSSLSSSSSLN